jgi:GT2 family glycosyltransferase
MIKSNYPKVLVGSPISDHHEYCYDSYKESLNNLSYPNFDILLVDNSKNDEFYNVVKKDFPCFKLPYFESVKDRLTGSRNILREKVLKEGYDYLFCLDQDVVPPRDIIERLVNSNQKIISGLYMNPFTRGGKTRVCPVAWVYHQDDKSKLVFVREDILSTNKTYPVNLVGTGCILIHRDVLAKLKFRTEKDKEGVDDSFFCIDAQASGYKIYLDTSIKCNHLVSGRPLFWGKKDLKT